MSGERVTGLLAIVLLSAAMPASAQGDVEKRLDDLERRVKALETVQQPTQLTPSTRPTDTESQYRAWSAKIRAKIRANIILPQGIPGNPEAIFDVSLLPTGEVLAVRKTKSSGHPGYDNAVERAIMKSSPLPKPDDSSLFQRQLELAFRPHGQ